MPWRWSITSTTGGCTGSSSSARPTPRCCGASWVYRRPDDRRALLAGAIGSLAIVAVWLATRTAGIPMGPDSGRPGSIGAMDTLGRRVGRLAGGIASGWASRWARRACSRSSSAATSTDPRGPAPRRRGPRRGDRRLGPDTRARPAGRALETTSPEGSASECRFALPASRTAPTRPARLGERPPRRTGG